MNLHDLVISSAMKFPEAPAIYHGNKVMTYAELDFWSNTLAKELIQFGVSCEDRVAIWAEKSPWVIAGMQAVLRLGATYVPLDPMCPTLRAKAILNDCQVRALLTTQDRASKTLTEDLLGLPHILLDQIDPSDWKSGASSTFSPQLIVSERSPAYILYTSGSTGNPKGICLSHRNALAFIEWAADTLETQPSDRFSSHAPFHFDLSILDLYAPFSKGASVSIIPEGLAYSPKRLVDFLHRERITHWYSVPSALILMMEHGGLLEQPTHHLKSVLFAGEPFPIKHLRRLREHLPHTRLLNLYGPTETNVCTYHEVDEVHKDQISPVPIGKSCCGNRVWAIRQDGTPITSAGEEGELLVRGPTVMLGYWGKPPLKNETYSTGDIVRLLEDGNFTFIGRRDHQVKVRGYRIDLGEIEATLLRLPDIIEAAVLVTGSGLNAKLFACLITKGDKILNLLELKKHCSERLPTYMILDGFTVFTEFPRTSTGKTDRKALLEAVLHSETQEKAAA